MQHATTLKRVRQALGQQRRAGRINPTDLALVRDNVGRLVTDALRDPAHALYDRATELRDFIEQHRTRLNTARADNHARAPSASQPPERLWFMPQPGNASVQRFWPLQLLLWTAAHSTSDGTLAEQLSLSAHQMKQASEAGHSHSITYWSATQFLNLLDTAMEEFEEMLPQPEGRAAHVVLSGRDLVVDGAVEDVVRLSRGEATFLRILADHRFGAVSHSTFAQAEVSPVDVKKRLMRKLEAHDVELQIVSSAGAYVLMTPVTVVT